MRCSTLPPVPMMLLVACTGNEPPERGSDTAPHPVTSADSGTEETERAEAVRCEERTSAGFTHQLCEMTVEGAARWFAYREPSSLVSGAAHPVFVFFHGGGIEAQQDSSGAPTGAIETIGNDWWAYAEDHGYILVLPHSSVEGDRQRHRWFWKNGDERSDYVFTAALVAWVSAERNADPSRIFAAGHSSGGIFTYSWAAGGPLQEPLHKTDPGLFRAISPSGANLILDTVMAPKQTAVPVLHVHGASDTNQLWEVGEADGTTVDGQGDTLFRQNPDGHWYSVWSPDQASTIGEWAQAAGCSDTPEVDESGECWHRYRYAPCSSGAEVEVRKMLNCGHAVGEQNLRFEYFSRFCSDGPICAWGQSCASGACVDVPDWSDTCQDNCPAQ